MPESMSDEVMSRLERLERENRLLKRCAAIALLVVGALVMMGQAPGGLRTLEAERLVIKYPNGKAAIVFGTLKDAVEESAVADFYMPNGSVGASLIAGEQSNRIRLLSPKKQLEMSFTAGSVRSTTPVANSEEYASFAIDQIAGRDLKGLLEVVADTHGEAEEYMFSQKAGTLRLTNGVNGPGIELLDNAKTLRAVLGTTRLQTTRTDIVESRPASSLVLFDKDGNVLWRAP